MHSVDNITLEMLVGFLSQDTVRRKKRASCQSTVYFLNDKEKIRDWVCCADWRCCNDRKS